MDSYCPYTFATATCTDGASRLVAEEFKKSSAVCLFRTTDWQETWRYDEGPAVAAFKKVVDHCERWEHLAMCGFVDDLEGVFFEVLADVIGRFPLLKTLRLNLRLNCMLSYYDLLDWRLDFFASAPKLKSLVIDDMGFFPVNRISLPWSQLTSVHAHRLTTLHCINLLTSCPNLTSCCFSDIEECEHAAEVTSTISAGSSIRDHLTKLKITNVYDSDIRFILHPFRCPAVRELSLDAHANRMCFNYLGLPAFATDDFYNHYDSMWSAVGVFVERSNCELEILEIAGSIYTNSVLTLLKNLPTLKKLYLEDKGTIQENEDGPGSFVSFFNTLAFFESGTNTHQTYLPQLKEFHYVGPSESESDITRELVDFTPILKGLEDRWNVPVAGVSRLEVFSAELDLGFDSNHVWRKGFKDLMVEGMQLSIKSLHGEDVPEPRE